MAEAADKHSSTFAIPDLEPESGHLDEIALLIAKRTSLPIGEVRKTLVAAIRHRQLRVLADDQPLDGMTRTALRAKQLGFIRDTFADTLSMWLDNGAEIGWDVGRIFVTMAGRVQPIRLPCVSLADALALFEVRKEKSASEEAPTAEEAAAPMGTAPEAPMPEPEQAASAPPAVAEGHVDPQLTGPAPAVAATVAAIEQADSITTRGETASDGLSDDDVIRAEIQRAIDEAEAKRQKPPNIKELWDIAGPQIKDRGVHVTRDGRFDEIAGEPKFKNQRGRPGPRTKR